MKRKIVIGAAALLAAVGLGGCGGNSYQLYYIKDAVDCPGAPPSKWTTDIDTRTNEQGHDELANAAECVLVGYRWKKHFPHWHEQRADIGVYKRVTP